MCEAQSMMLDYRG